MNLFIILFIYCLTIIDSQEEENKRDYLWKEFSNKKGTAAFIDVIQWREKLKNDFLKSLNGLSEALKKELIKRADKANSTPWESYRVSQFLEYVKTGNRVHFEHANDQRRSKLGRLVIGELLTETGKYIDQIADGIWLMMEESTWETPGHLHIQKSGSGLPDPEDIIIDLRVGEAAAMISWIKLLLHDKLAKYAPKDMLLKRIDYEINRRIVRPYLDNGNRWWWSGFAGVRVNNHNIWNNANILFTVLMTIDNATLRNEVIEKTVKSSDYFLDGYPDDGGCDEGPAYWVHASGQLIRYVYLLSQLSNGVFSWASNELIQKMGSYIAKVHIDNEYFVNFADAAGKVIPEPDRVLKFGLLSNDTRMIQFAAYLYNISVHEKEFAILEKSPIIHKFADVLDSITKFKDLEGKAPYLHESWFKDLQVLTLRSKEGSSKGAFIGTKGGHNNENHNHNDVGTFIFYIDGRPALIDVGVGTYTNDTFSKNRYNIWLMQSQWHNVPSINGYMQHDGKEYRARNVSFKKDSDGHGVFELDIAEAYPKEASINSWKRTLVFDGSAKKLNITEDYKLKEWKKPFQLHFISALNDIDQSQKGKIILKDSQTSLLIEYNEQHFQVHTEKRSITDDHLLVNVWGEHITRVNLTAKSNDLIGKFTYTIKAHKENE